MKTLPVSSLRTEPVALGQVALDIEAHLHDHVLECWFPRCLDHSDGGFHQDFARDWSFEPDTDKSLVFQARMTWVAGSVARHRPTLRDTFIPWTTHGLTFLRERLWDTEYGGFRFSVEDTGDKHSYGIAFGIYAAAAAYRATGDEGALDLARRAFQWWDANAHDDEHGGYFEALRRDGTPITTAHAGTRKDRLGVPRGLKSSNTLIHTLEALTELHQADPDDLVRRRLDESLGTLEEIVATQAGRLATTFARDWQPLNRTTSYGHDVEAVFLVAEARDALAMRGPSGTERLVDRATTKAYDTKHGGLYFHTRPRRFVPLRQTVREKIWWVQAEALNFYLWMHERHLDTTSVYLDRFLGTWAFIRSHQIDRQHGGWFGRVGRDGRTVLDDRKGHAWKAAYHDARALLHVSDRLSRLAQAPDSPLS